MLSPLREYPALGRGVATIRLCRMLLPDLCGGGGGEGGGGGGGEWRGREERRKRGKGGG